MGWVGHGWLRLCAQAGESAGVVDVDVASSSAARTATGAATTSTAATLATEVALAAGTTTAATAAATATAEAARALLTAAVNVAEVDLVLVLCPALARLVLGLAGKVVLDLALDGLALGELLARALVGLADRDAGVQLGLLLDEVGKVFVVALDLVLKLGLGGAVGLGVDVGSLLLLGNVLAGNLVGKLLGAVVAAPALLGLLRVVTGDC